MKKVLSTLAAVVLTLSATAVVAAPSSIVVNKSTCSKVANTKQPFILILDHGDDVIGSITQCAKDAKLLGASFVALGQVHNPTLAYFTSNPTDKPTLTKFPGYYELASMTGDITNNDNKYYTHAHAVLADKQFHGIAGHVDSAEAGLTVEVTIVPLPAVVHRTVDAKTGFGPIEH